MSLIQVNNVYKEYKVYNNEKGILNSAKSLFHRNYTMKKAVSDISFNIDRGELVGYIGQNGAGKSTTIKMLSGVLTPTAGSIYVDGIEPYVNRKENAGKIGVVFGQRSQLYWELPIQYSFELYKKIYKIDDKVFKDNVDMFMELLNMKEFYNRPVRLLSLGEKMKANIAIALLHNPHILYLDEPTIGLDVIAKDKIRHFIKDINKARKTTVILTTHDLDDIEEICDRIIIIDKGKKIYDGLLSKLKADHNKEFVIEAIFYDKSIITDSRFNVVINDENKKVIKCNRDEINSGDAITYLAKNYKIKDISIIDKSLEDIVKNIYEKTILKQSH
jgi:ABC-2 type transport system ATP-binding protein